MGCCRNSRENVADEQLLGPSVRSEDVQARKARPLAWSTALLPLTKPSHPSRPQRSDSLGSQTTGSSCRCIHLSSSAAFDHRWSSSKPTARPKQGGLISITAEIDVDATIPLGGKQRDCRNCDPPPGHDAWVHPSRHAAGWRWSAPNLPHQLRRHCWAQDFEDRVAVATLAPDHGEEARYYVIIFTKLTQYFS